MVTQTIDFISLLTGLAKETEAVLKDFSLTKDNLQVEVSADGAANYYKNQEWKARDDFAGEDDLKENILYFFKNGFHDDACGA